jgi:hypothetical protein
MLPAMAGSIIGDTSSAAATAAPLNRRRIVLWFEDPVRMATSWVSMPRDHPPPFAVFLVVAPQRAAQSRRGSLSQRLIAA